MQPTATSTLREELLPMAVAAQRQRQEQYWIKLREKAKNCIRVQVWEGDLAGGIAHYRVHLPYFELSNGRSVAFLNLAEDNTLKKVGNGFSYVPVRSLEMSWKGMRIRQAHRPRFASVPTCSIEIDWISELSGTISVNRQGINLTREAEESWILAKNEIAEKAADFFADSAENPPGFLNYRILGSPLPSEGHWIAGDKVRRLEPIIFPCTTSAIWAYDASVPDTIRVGSREIVVQKSFQENDAHWKGRSFSSHNLMPDELVWIGTSAAAIIPVWKQLRVSLPGEAISKTKFPATWEGVIAVRFEHFLIDTSPTGNLIFDEMSSLISALDSDSWRWAKEMLEQERDFVSYRHELLKPERTIAWILAYLATPVLNLWNGLVERAPEITSEMWTRLETFGHDGGPLRLWYESGYAQILREISPTGFKTNKPKGLSPGSFPPVVP